MRVACAALAAALLASWGWAAGVTVVAPPDRFVAPGEYVTLVFRVTAVERTETRLEAVSERGWPILRQPGVLVLEPGRSTPVALTLEVPRGAEAASRDLVTLRGDLPASPLEASVTLTVSERVELALEASSEAWLGEDGLQVLVRNDGNTTEEVRVVLRRGSEILDEQALSMVAGASDVVVFGLVGEGLHSVVLSSASGAEVRRSVRVQRDASQAPDPFRVTARLAGSVSASGAWQGLLTVRGPLSDFARLDARVDAGAYRRSFAAVELEHWSLRVGSGGGSPYRLDLPASWGVAAAYRGDGWGVTGSLGSLGDARFSAQVAGVWRPPSGDVAVGVAVRDGDPLAALRVEFRGENSDTVLAARYRAGTVSVALTTDLQDDDGTTQVTVEAQELLGHAARLRFSVRYRSGPATMYGDVSAPLGADASWGGRVGWSEDLVTALPGRLRAAVQVGLRESFARVTHRVLLDGGWRADTTLGVRLDAHGMGVTVVSAWDRLGVADVHVDGRLAYYPVSGRLDGSVRMRYTVPLDRLQVGLGGTWHLTDRALGVSGVVGWREGAWEANVNGAVHYAYAGNAARRWSTSVGVSAAYTFEVEVPAGLTDAAGGRRVGTLRGTVMAADEPIQGIVVEIGRMRVTTDDEGRFELRLSPGEYDVTVDLRSLPIVYRLREPDGTRVRVDLRGEHELTIEAVRTAALRGRVLEDSSGDGVPDEPLRGVDARLLLMDVDGLRRSVPTDAEGRFEVRGLAPGSAELRLVDVPRGAGVVGEDRVELTLSAAQPAEVVFVVRPVQAVARAFSPATLRIRAVELERDRLPPGAAPIVRVQLQSEADSVVVEGPGGAVGLQRDGAAWVGRVPLAEDLPAGVYTVRVVARDGDSEVSRGAQLVVEARAPLLELAGDGPVRAGGTLTVRASLYVDARAATLAHPFGPGIELDEVEPGRWVGAIRVPSDAEDAVYEALVTFTLDDGRRLEETLRFRVLASGQ